MILALTFYHWDYPQFSLLRCPVQSTQVHRRYPNSQQNRPKIHWFGKLQEISEQPARATCLTSIGSLPTPPRLMAWYKQWGQMPFVHVRSISPILQNGWNTLASISCITPCHMSFTSCKCPKRFTLQSESATNVIETVLSSRENTTLICSSKLGLEIYRHEYIGPAAEKSTGNQFINIINNKCSSQFLLICPAKLLRHILHLFYLIIG